MEKIKILIADDHPIFREGLCQVLEGENDLEVIARASDGEECVRLAKELVPEIALIDIAMPKLNGLEAAKQIKADLPSIAILILSAYSYESYILASIEMGAAGYILKDTYPRDIVNAIYSIHDGEMIYNLKSAGKILQRLVRREAKDEKDCRNMYNRELNILKMAAEGLTNKEIARKLFISERTVQSHMVNIFRKLKVGSRTEAVVYALSIGLLNLDELSMGKDA